MPGWLEVPLFASLASLACCHVNVTAGSSVLAGGRNAGLNAVFQEITFANQLPTGVQKEILQMKCGYLKKNNNTFHSNNNTALEVQVSKQPLLK